MDNASFISAHWFKRKRDACLSHAIGGEFGHRLQLCLTRGAKSVNVANEPLSGGEASSEHLIDQMLQRFEQLSQPISDSIRVNNDAARVQARALLDSAQVLRLDSLVVRERGTIGGRNPPPPASR